MDAFLFELGGVYEFFNAFVVEPVATEGTLWHESLFIFAFDIGDKWFIAQKAFC